MSMLALLALSSMKARRGSTSSPISVVKDFIGQARVFELYLQHATHRWIECGFPQFFGIHFAEVFVALDVVGFLPSASRARSERWRMRWVFSLVFMRVLRGFLRFRRWRRKAGR